MMMHDPRAVARMLGGQIAGRDTVLVPGPGHSTRDRSLAVRLDPSAPDGFLVFSHAGDDWKTCRDYVRARLGLSSWPRDEQRWAIPPPHVAKWDFAAIEADAQKALCAWSEDEVLRINAAQRLWNEGIDPRRTVAESYLREQRKLDLPHELASSVLRFHPRCPWRNENTGTIDKIPALIAPFRSIDDDAITGIQRIALNSDGTKLGRRMLGIVQRGAIKLDAATGDKLAIGEGVETAMAARQLGFEPVWAVGSVGAISFFPLIDHVNQLLILGESGDASARAIRFCGKRWHKAGRRVRVVMPNSGGDLNDVLAEGACS